MPTILLLIAAVIGAGNDVPLKEFGITLPEEIGKLKFQGRKEYGADLGYSVGYGNKMCWTTLYIYDLGVKDIPEAKESAVIQEQLQAAQADIVMAQDKKLVKNLTPIETDLPLSKTVLERFAASGYTFDIKGGACKSYALVTGHQGKFFKIRVTQYVVDGKTNDDELNEFLEAITAKIAKPTN